MMPGERLFNELREPLDLGQWSDEPAKLRGCWERAAANLGIQPDGEDAPIPYRVTEAGDQALAVARHEAGSAAAQEANDQLRRALGWPDGEDARDDLLGEVARLRAVAAGADPKSPDLADYFVMRDRARIDGAAAALWRAGIAALQAINDLKPEDCVDIQPRHRQAGQMLGIACYQCGHDSTAHLDRAYLKRMRIRHGCVMSGCSCMATIDHLRETASQPTDPSHAPDQPRCEHIPPLCEKHPVQALACLGCAEEREAGMEHELAKALGCSGDPGSWNGSWPALIESAGEMATENQAVPRCDKEGHSGLVCTQCAHVAGYEAGTRDRFEELRQILGAGRDDDRDELRFKLRHAVDMAVLHVDMAVLHARCRTTPPAALPPPDPTETRTLVDLLDQELARIGTLIRHGGAAAARIELLQRCRTRLLTLIEPPAAPAGGAP